MIKGSLVRSTLNLPKRKRGRSITQPFSPLSFGTNLWAWAEFYKTQNMVMSGSYIASLQNSVNPGHVWSNTSDTVRPTLVQNVQNNRAVSRWDGSDDVLNSNINNPKQNNFCYAAVFSANNTISIQTESTSGASGVSGQRWLLMPSGRSPCESGISVGTNGIGVYEHGPGYLPALCVYSGAVSGFNVVVVNCNEIRSCIYLNGSLVKTGLVSTGNGAGLVNAPMHIGGGAYGKFSGDIGEVVFVSDALSTLERNQLEGYLAWGWGLQSKLPIGHPYKDFW